MVVLRPRRWVVPATALLALGSGAALASGLAGAGQLRWAVVAASGVLLVVALLGLWQVPRLRYEVDADEVRLWTGRRLRRRLPYAGLTEVRFVRSGFAYSPGWDHVVLLTGRSYDGQVRRVRVSGALVGGLGPVLAALEPELARRPGLLHAEPGLLDELRRQG